MPESEHHKLVSGARVYVAVYLAIFAWAVAIGSWLPILFFFVARIYGAWLHTLLTFTQHAGLAENVRDHRRNSRDVYMNPLFAFLYWNMNYHIEHHIYPLVPFHALPALHEEIKDPAAGGARRTGRGLSRDRGDVLAPAARPVLLPRSGRTEQRRAGDLAGGVAGGDLHGRGTGLALRQAQGEASTGSG